MPIRTIVAAILMLFVCANGFAQGLAPESAASRNIQTLLNNINNGGGGGNSTTHHTLPRTATSGNGITIRANGSGGGVNIQSFQNNTVSNNRNSGVVVSATNGGTVRLNDVNENTVSNNGGNGVVISANAGNVTVGTMNGNLITGNQGDGIQLLAESSGTISINDLSENTITGNGGNGISVQSTGGTITANLNANDLSGNGGAGLSVTSSGGNVTLNVGGPNAGDGNSISANSGGGIGLNVLGTGFVSVTGFGNQIVSNTGGGVNLNVLGAGQGNLTLSNNNISSNSASSTTANDGNGVRIAREENGLFAVELQENTITNNEGDGLAVTTLGSDSENPDQPFDGTPNLLHFLENQIMGNLGNGVSITARADSVIYFVGVQNLITGNALDGVALASLQDSALGNPVSGLPPGTSSVLDANTITGNTGSGISLSANGGSQANVSVLSTVGDTVISANGSNGITLLTSGTTTSHLAVDADFGFTTTITGNAGSGLQIAAIESSNVIVGVTSTEISGNTGGAAGAGHGIELTASDSASPTLLVGATGQGNLIQGNAGNGLNIDISGTAAPVVFAQDNVITANQGDGINIALQGPQDASSDRPGLTAVFDSNLITENEGNGARVNLQGAGGTRDNPLFVQFSGNNISSNAMTGISLTADPGFVQNVAVSFPNALPAGTNLPTAPFDPNSPPFFALNSLGNIAYQPPFQNLNTAQNTRINITGNTIQNNGTGTVDGAGVDIAVGTNSHVAADIRNNRFGGNLNEDLRTRSFISGPDPDPSIDDVNPNNDTVFLDDTAQLDMRFTGNSGNQISVQAGGAVYTNNDPGKGGANRSVFLFQVEDGVSLNQSNGFVNSSGVTQDIRGSFNDGGYNIRLVADPNFPNPQFPPALP